MPTQEMMSTPEVIFVAGAGARAMSASIMFRLMAQELDGRDVSYDAIDGLYYDEAEDVQIIKPARMQVDELHGKIAEISVEKPVLLIAQCIGTVAALQTLENFKDTRPVGLVSISPPLPSPRTTTSQPTSQAKRSQNNTRMRVLDFPEGSFDFSRLIETSAHLDERYFEDLYEADNLEQRLRLGVEAGDAMVFATECDWNNGSPEHVSGWHDLWDSVQPADQAAALKSRAFVIPGAGHSLNPSGRTDLTGQQKMRMQAESCARILDAGLSFAAGKMATHDSDLDLDMPYLA